MFLRRVFTPAPDTSAPHQGYVVVGSAATPSYLAGQGDGSLLRETLKVCLVLLVAVEGEQINQYSSILAHHITRAVLRLVWPFVFKM